MTDIIYRSKNALLEFVADNCTNLSASNNITAGFFYGDGSNLTNLPGGGGGDPGGSTTQVQYNNAGSFAGSANLTFDGTTLTVAGLSNTGNTTLGNASGDSVTINAATINPANIAEGTDNSVVVYNGSSLVTDEIDSRVWGSTLVDASGTPVDNQVGIWTDANTLEGSSNLTFDGTDLTVGGDLTVAGNDIKGSGGTAITMDVSNNVTIAGDLTVGGLNIMAPADSNLFFNTDKSMYFDIDEDNDETDQIFRWRATSTTLMTLTEAADLEIAGDLTASANLLVSGGDITLGAATSYIRDPQGHQRISIAGTGNIVLYDASGGTEFTVANGTCTAAGNLTVSGDLFVNDYARIDALRIGTTSQDPGVDGNLYIEGATTAVGQITPGYDPQILAQNIFDPSSYALFTITNDADYLYIVDWDTGATSTTNPKVAFEAPAEGKVIVDVKCFIDDTSTSGAGPYIYAAMSSNYGTAGTKISKTDASIVGNGEKIIWYPDESDRGTRQFSFYVSGLTGGSTYTWYLYMRRWNDGDANRVICGGSYPMFEMSVRPIYSSALIYTT